MKEGKPVWNMLTEDEIREIETELEHCEARPAGSVEALRVVQRHRGWVCDEALRDAAELLGMSAEELDGVATFYPFVFRRPVGRHVILVCDSVSCWIMGHEEVLACLMNRLDIGLGETTPDDRFTLLPVSCIGACDHAPAMMIDEDLHGDLNPGGINDILERYP
jgi:NADH-quinone oxidoreductase subunit E